jgi:hypothetical protein
MTASAIEKIAAINAFFNDAPKVQRPKHRFGDRVLRGISKK